MATSDRPVIYDAAGQPVRVDRKALAADTDFASVRRFGRPFDDTVASGLTPRRVPAILRAATRGDMFDFLTLAEEMEEREPQYGAVLGTRKRAVSSIDMIVEPASDSDADTTIAAACRTLIDQPDFIDMLDDALDGLGKGFAVVEMIWDTTGPQWMPRDFIWQDPRLFQFDPKHRRRVRIREDGNEAGIALKPAKFVTHMPKLKSGMPIRSALARLAIWSFVLKSYTLKDWAAFCEVYGMPLRLGRHHAGASDRDKADLLRAVTRIASDAAAIIPQGMEIEFIQSKAGAGDPVFGGFAKYLDSQISKIVLGQTMTTDNGSSMAQAQVHNEVRLDIKQADARQLEGTINKDVIRPFVDLNFGLQTRYPRVKLPVAEPEDTELLSRVLERMVPLGVRIAASDARERLGFSEPAEGADLLTMPGAGVAALDEQRAENRALALNEASGGASADDLIDEIGRDELAEWGGQMEPLLAPIRALVEEAQSLEDIRDRLADLVGNMNETELARGINRARLKARGVGDAKG